MQNLRCRIGFRIELLYFKTLKIKKQKEKKIQANTDYGVLRLILLFFRYLTENLKQGNKVLEAQYSKFIVDKQNMLKKCFSFRYI